MKTKTWLSIAWIIWTAQGLNHLHGAAAFAGITEPILEAVMSSPVPGIVGARPFREGDFVNQGQVVIELDKKLEELEVQRRKAMLDPLKSDLDATRTLYEKNSIGVSKEALIKAESAYNVAVAEYELAKEQLRKRQIVAPFSGYIVEMFREVGESCQANEKLVRMVDTRRCYFVSNIEAKAGYRLKVGEKVKLEIEAGEPAISVQGTISFISPVVDAASGLLKVKLIFENADGKFRPGVAGRMTLAEGKDGR